jgi:hypothetical protein
MGADLGKRALLGDEWLLRQRLLAAAPNIDIVPLCGAANLGCLGRLQISLICNNFFRRF